MSACSFIHPFIRALIDAGQTPSGTNCILCWVMSADNMHDVPELISMVPAMDSARAKRNDTQCHQRAVICAKRVPEPEYWPRESIWKRTNS